MKKGTFFIAVGLIGLMLGSASVAIGNDVGCVNTWGYWLNHSKYQNDGGAHRDPAWDLVLGGAGEDTPFFSSGMTWYEILLIPPKGGNAYVILAHQYVAAYLNIQNGADPGILGATIADAAALLAKYAAPPSPPVIPKNDPDRPLAEQLASQLDQFNSGYISPGPCLVTCTPQECFTYSTCDISCAAVTGCYTTAEGGGVCGQSVACGGLTPCTQSSECSGGICAVDTCCGSAGVCIPIADLCHANASDLSEAVLTSTPFGPTTLGK